MANDFEKFGTDRSQGATYAIGIHTQNSKLTPEQRIALAHAIRNAARMVAVQMELACAEHAKVSLIRQTTSSGQVTIPLAGDDDE